MSSAHELHSRFAVPTTVQHTCLCRDAAGELMKLRQVCHDLLAIIEHSADTFFVTDGNGVILLVNRAYEQLSGESRERLIGRNVAEFVDHIYSESATLQVIKNRKPITIEQHLLHSGRITYVTSQPIFDAAGNIIMIISNNRDFTEIERLKVKLENSEELISKYQLEIEAIRSQCIADTELVAADKQTLDVLYN